MTLGVLELSQRLGARIVGDPPAVQLAALATPAQATVRDVSFALPGNGAWAQSNAAAIIAGRDTSANPTGKCLLLVDDVQLACARLVAWLPIGRHRLSATPVSVSRAAATARISPHAFVDARAVIGESTCIEAGAVIGPQVMLGDFCRIGPGAVITGQTQIGNRVEIGAGTVIGEDGFAFVRDGSSWLRMPSFGGVLVKDDVVILARSVVHAGVFGDTIIEAGCVLDSQVLIGHDSRVGAGTAIAGHSALAGSSVVGRGCLIGGQVGIGEGVRLADGITVTGMSMVSRSLDDAGGRYSSGWPVEPSRTWWRRVGRLKRIAEAGRPGDDEQ